MVIWGSERILPRFVYCEVEGKSIFNWFEMTSDEMTWKVMKHQPLTKSSDSVQCLLLSLAIFPFYPLKSFSYEAKKTNQYKVQFESEC